MSLPPVFLLTRSTNAGGKRGSCPKSIPIFFIDARLSFRAKPEAKSRNLSNFRPQQEMSRLSLDMTQTSRVVNSHGHRSFEPGALREERNEAVLTTLSRGRCLNR